jgi:hypothetical protein
MNIAYEVHECFVFGNDWLHRTKAGKMVDNKTSDYDVFQIKHLWEIMQISQEQSNYNQHDMVSTLWRPVKEQISWEWTLMSWEDLMFSCSHETIPR